MVESIPTWDQARAAWNQRDWKQSESLYQAAIVQGGLSPSELLLAHVRMGCSRSQLGRRGPGLEAFRSAAILDPGFEIPLEAGPTGRLLATQAKKERASIGAISIVLDVPSVTKLGAPLVVRVALTSAHVKLTQSIVIQLRDGARTLLHSDRATSSESVRFEVPTRVLPPSATITVTAEALDGYTNRLASTESSTIVEKDRDAVSLPPYLVQKPTPAGPAQPSPGFWSSPWPYVIGGSVLLAAGGAVGVYFLTRPPDTATFARPHITWGR